MSVPVLLPARAQRAVGAPAAEKLWHPETAAPQQGAEQLIDDDISRRAAQLVLRCAGE